MAKLYEQYENNTLMESYRSSGQTAKSFLRLMPPPRERKSRRGRRRPSMIPWFFAVTVLMAAAAMILIGWRTDPFGAVPPGADATDETPPQSTFLPAAANGESRLSLIYQDPELPNGCEVTSLAMLLKWAGCPIDKVELAENYLPKEDFVQAGSDRLGPNPSQAYAGDPASAEGWYCFEGPIVDAGNTWLNEQNSNFQVVSLTGLTRKSLEDYLDLNIPLAVWVTLNYAPPKLSFFQWTLPDGVRYAPYSNLHCVVLVGREGGGYQIADPISGWQIVSPALFWTCFDAMGRRAAAVLPD